MFGETIVKSRHAGQLAAKAMIQKIVPVAERTGSIDGFFVFQFTKPAQAQAGTCCS